MQIILHGMWKLPGWKRDLKEKCMQSALSAVSHEMLLFLRGFGSLDKSGENLERSLSLMRSATLAITAGLCSFPLRVS